MEKTITTKVQKLRRYTHITTIPKIICDKYKLKKGDVLEWDIKDNRIVIRRGK